LSSSLGASATITRAPVATRSREDDVVPVMVAAPAAQDGGCEDTPEAISRR
jgi:hypothetical protein